MPELPEVRAHAERLHERFRGEVLDAFTPLAFTTLKTHDPPADAAVGARLEAVDSRGKHLVLRFGDVAMVVHLMQGGRLREDTARSRRPRGGLARWSFGVGGALLLTEAGTERKAGVWVVAGDPDAAEPLAGLGPDADRLDEVDLGLRLAARPGRLHTVLRDQSALAGIGRRLANEVCHRAELSPFTSTARLSDAQVGKVHEAIQALVEEELARERAREEMSKAAERATAVHGRAGASCPRCSDTVRAVEYRDYTVFYCPTCQTGGRVLADNTTSKFLR